MAIKALIKSHLLSSKYIFRSGKEANFVNGRYTTDIEEEVEEFKREIGEVGVNNSRHPHLYVDEAEQTVDSDQLDPLEYIRKQAVADYLAAQAIATNPENDMGSTPKEFKLNTASSSTVKALAAESSSTTA